MSQRQEPIPFGNLTQNALGALSFLLLLIPSLWQPSTCTTLLASLLSLSLLSTAGRVEQGVQSLLLLSSASWEPPNWQIACAGNLSWDCVVYWEG